MERSICDEAIISKHNRFKCWSCRRKIGKELPVLRKSEASRNYGYVTHSYCYHCAAGVLKGDENIAKELTETNQKVAANFEKIKGECSKALVLDAITKKSEEEKHRAAYEESEKLWKESRRKWDEERLKRDDQREQEILDLYEKIREIREKKKLGPISPEERRKIFSGEISL